MSSIPTDLKIPTDLTGLRRRLDEIDDRLQDLLIDRAAVVSMVATNKKDANQPAFQPAREAEIIRRLIKRHHGAFPVATLVRMWREMLAATVRLQSPFTAAVFVPPDRQGFWDLARDHYGSHTPMTPCDDTDEVIRAVADGEASIGVLPMPQAGEENPWWPRLVSSEDDWPRIIARLPFGARGNARTDSAEALAIGRGPHRESGLDRTLLAAECETEIDQGRIRRLLADLQLDCTLYASHTGRGGWVSLIEIDGFLPVIDGRLDAVRAELGVALRMLIPIGGYAVPLPSASLAES